MGDLDAVVVGGGPNGLAAAITIAQAGRRVLLFEAADRVGGGCRTEALTLPGFLHDVCSAVHPLAVASPFFRSLPLRDYGLDWVAPPITLAHPLDEGDAVCLHESLERTVAGLGSDGPAYAALFAPLVDAWPALAGPVLGTWRWPSQPLAVARAALRAMLPARQLASRLFAGEPARALLAGIAAHGMLPLEQRPSGAVALALGLLGHVCGWRIPRGGAQRITDALAAHLRSLGGEIVTGTCVATLDALPPARATLCDLSPRPFLRIAGHRLPAGYRRALERYRYGMAAFKVDWALDAPIPWRSAACRLAATVHLGGRLDEIACAERDAWEGRPSSSPFVLLSQPTLFDGSRAPAGQHVAWGYCHVPAGSTTDMLTPIEQQIERFAPGFRDRVIARAVMRPADIERRNPNFVGGDIAAGVTTVGQLVTRPTWRTYSTPVRGLYLCSASTPPGVGVHGLCGYFAARRALKDVLRD